MRMPSPCAPGPTRASTQSARAVIHCATICGLAAKPPSAITTPHRPGAAFPPPAILPRHRAGAGAIPDEEPAPPGPGHDPAATVAKVLLEPPHQHVATTPFPIEPGGKPPRRRQHLLPWRILLQR